MGPLVVTNRLCALRYVGSLKLKKNGDYRKLLHAKVVCKLSLSKALCVYLYLRKVTEVLVCSTALPKIYTLNFINHHVSLSRNRL